EILQHGGAAGLDAVRLEQRQRQHVGAASLRADRHPLSLELGEAVNPRAGVEHRERLIEHAPQRDEALDLHAIGYAPLHEADVDGERGIRQALEVLQRAVRREDFELDAVSREYLAVALG